MDENAKEKLYYIIAVLNTVSVAGEQNMNRQLYCIQQLKAMAEVKEDA